jgi:large subunit ribosomal protein L24
MQDTKRVKNPGKQRKKLFNAPAHIRHKLMSAPLSHELTASRGAKTLPVRKGDTILIKRGDNKGFEGKVSRVDLKTFHIYVEGLTREKVDGTNIFLPIHPSKVEIRNLNLDDKWRKNILERKQAPTKKVEKPIAKPAKKAEKAPVKEEKPVKVTPVEEEAVSEVAEEQVPKMNIAEAPAKKTAAKKATKKAPTAKKIEEEEAPKSRSKPKASEKTDGGQ